jgi:hypothetical protein
MRTHILLLMGILMLTACASYRGKTPLSGQIDYVQTHHAQMIDGQAFRIH